MRVLLACLMQVKSREALTLEQIYTVTADNLADLAGIKKGFNYRELKSAANELRSLYVIVYEKPNAEIGAPDVTHINVTSSVRYYDKEGKISLRFGPEIIPYISSLRKRFTQYQAKHVMPMKSSYGVQIYELCLQWLGSQREFSINAFKRLLGLEDKYHRIEVLKRRVIKPALKDINTYSDIHVEFSQRKTGRRVSHLKFITTRPGTNKTAPKITQKHIEKNALPGETWEAARRRLGDKTP